MQKVAQRYINNFPKLVCKTTISQHLTDRIGTENYAYVSVVFHSDKRKTSDGDGRGGFRDNVEKTVKNVYGRILL